MLLAAAFLFVLPIAALQESADAGHSVSHPCDLVASTAGSDADPGTLEQPLGTVQTLLTLLQPGQTGCLRGTAAAEPFRENVTVSNKNAAGGSEATRITIRSYPGEIAKLRGRIHVAADANYVTFSRLVLDGRDAVQDPPVLSSPRIDGDHVAFEDNNISAAGAVPCVTLGNATKTSLWAQLRRNRIHGCRDAISASASRGATVMDNLVYDNAGWGLRLGPNGDSTTVMRNIFDGNDGGVLFSGDAIDTSIGNPVNRNIIANSGPEPNVDSSWNPFNVPPMQFNFLFRSCVYDPPALDGDGGIDTSAGGYAAVAPIDDSDPGYDEEANDFHITPSSPCYRYTGDVAATVEAGGGPTDEEASADNQKPNVLFIISDDQRADDSIRPQTMPKTIARLRERGTDYGNAFATTPLCCPSRGSIFSGRYAHNHGVHANALGSHLESDFTLQRYLKDAGYKTGIFGKYLNEWELKKDPPAWDRWAVFDEGHCGWRVNEQGQLKTYGTLASTASNCPQGSPYSADYVAEQATGSAAAPGGGFLDETESNDSQPWFMYLAPNEPHGPYQPEYEYKDLDVGTIDERPAYSEGQAGGDPITDKPDQMQWLCKEHPSDSTCTTNGAAQLANRARQLRMLRSVDDMVGTVLDELERHGEQDTIIVFMGDNGLMWGEHGLPLTKTLPYTESIKVPFMMRYPPRTAPGVTDDSMVANVDLAPTVLEAAGLSVPPGSPPVDGISLLDSSKERTRMLTEATRTGGFLTDDGEICKVGTACFEPYEVSFGKWASTRTSSYQYTEWYEDDGITVRSREYYPATDADQLTNVLADGVPGNEPDTATVNSLSRQLARDRFCRGEECPGGTGQGPLNDPIPPHGFVSEPAPGDRVCCRVHLQPSVGDNVGIESVQFYVDDSPIGPPDDTYPYDAIWDSDSANQAQQVTQHDVKILMRDVGGNEAFSPVTTLNVDRGLDVQIEDPSLFEETPSTNWFVEQRPGAGDTITYSFGRTITPGDLVPGWNPGQPADCVARPASCVTVSLVNAPPGQGSSDGVKVYTNTTPRTELTAFGSIDLVFDGIVGADRDFPDSALELVDGGKAIKITLGTPASPVTTHQWNEGTSIWTIPPGTSYCDGCTVLESIDGTDSVEDREF